MHNLNSNWWQSEEKKKKSGLLSRVFSSCVICWDDGCPKKLFCLGSLLFWKICVPNWEHNQTCTDTGTEVLEKRRYTCKMFRKSRTTSLRTVPSGKAMRRERELGLASTTTATVTELKVPKKKKKKPGGTSTI